MVMQRSAKVFDIPKYSYRGRVAISAESKTKRQERGSVYVTGGVIVCLFWVLLQMPHQVRGQSSRSIHGDNLAAGSDKPLLAVASDASALQLVLPAQVPMNEWQQEVVGQGIELSVPKFLVQMPVHGVDTAVALF